MANNQKNKNKVNNRNNGKGNNYKKEEKRDNHKKEEIKVTKVEEVKKEEKVNKEKRSFSLDSKQKDILLVLLVVVLLVVGLVLTTPKKEKLDIELPVALSGEAGFSEITYEQYKEKVASNEPFLVVIVRDGCGYCEMYEPIVEEVANENKLPFYFINLTNLTDEDKDELSSTNKYLKRNNWGTPTTLFMYGENIIDSISGYVEKDTFVDFVKENIKVEE